MIKIIYTLLFALTCSLPSVVEASAYPFALERSQWMQHVQESTALETPVRAGKRSFGKICLGVFSDFFTTYPGETTMMYLDALSRYQKLSETPGLMERVDSIRHVRGYRYNSLLERYRSYLRKYGPRDILVASDIDTTVIDTQDFLGSDDWFMDERRMMARGDGNFSDFKEIFDTMVQIHRERPLVRTEDDVVDVINEISGKSSFLFLTSRGDDWEQKTFDDLTNLRINTPWMTDPYVTQWSTPVPGIVYAAFSHLELAEPKKNLHYSRGVFYTKGLDKGASLRAFLAENGMKPKVILFIDNDMKHILSLQSAFTDQDIVVETIHYDGPRIPFRK